MASPRKESVHNVTTFKKSKTFVSDKSLTIRSDIKSQKSRFPVGMPVDQSWSGLKLNSKKTSKKRINIAEIVKNLREFEKEVSTLDKYVAYCLKKYKNFKYDIKNFADDQLLLQAMYTEAHFVENGHFNGMLFWGQHLAIDNKFEPHGMGILVDIKHKIIQFGTFKHG